jgi:hypothetical protein
MDAMPEYTFRYGNSSDGTLHLQHVEACLGDDAAILRARGIRVSGAERYQLEIWRGDDCIYRGIPSGWPFRSRASKAKLPAQASHAKAG